MMNGRRGVQLLALCAAVFGLTAIAAHACVTLTPVQKTIRISDEQALIIWDATQRREDFIRRADFVTNAHDFGFLVPVPSTPTLTEVDDDVFDILRRNVQPELRSGGYGGGLGGVTKSEAVDVIRQQQVAGYDATILAASDARALHRWLRENGYATPEGLDEWVQSYIEKRWKIVAFKMSRQGAGAEPSGVSSKLVRISFNTDRPFYQYREPLRAVRPSDAKEHRKLVVYFLSTTPVKSTIGLGNTTWIGRQYAINPIGNSELSLMAKDLDMPMSELPSNPTLTTFVDDSSPRNGWADLWFDPQSKTANAR